MVATLLVRADGTSCGASMVKMSVDFPNEAARCQRFSSGRAQSNFDAQGKPGPVARCDRVIQAATPTDMSHPQRPKGTHRPSLTSVSILREATLPNPKVIVS